MLENIQAYLSKQGVKYIKPEKAGPHKEEMEDLKALGQAARKEMQTLAKLLEERLAPFKMDRVSNWANQAQICRPHFWCYYRAPEDSLDDVAMAIRLYGQPEKWGISVEVSFVERKKSDTTLAKQHKVLDLPIAPSLYYFAQENGVSHRVEGTEANRQLISNKLHSFRNFPPQRYKKRSYFGNKNPCILVHSLSNTKQSLTSADVSSVNT